MHVTFGGCLPLCSLRLSPSSPQWMYTINNPSALDFHCHSLFYLSPCQFTLSPSNLISPKEDRTHWSIIRPPGCIHLPTISGTHAMSSLKPHMTNIHLRTSNYKVRSLESPKFHSNDKQSIREPWQQTGMQPILFTQASMGHLYATHCYVDGVSDTHLHWCDTTIGANTVMLTLP